MSPPTESPSAGDPTGPAATGIAGLDFILQGGLPRDEIHLVQGVSGTGKTTLALQFLLAGASVGETGLYVTLSQTKRGLEAIARSHGWALDGLVVHELVPGDSLGQEKLQTVLHTAEVELTEVTAEIRELVTRVRPRRIVFDSLGVIGLLAGSPARHRREIVTLRRFLMGCGITAMFIGEGPAEGELDRPANSEFHSLAGSIIHLEQKAPDFGEVRRRLRVLKVRGVAFHGGYHNFRILQGGLELYPRLEVTREEEYTDFRFVPSGLAPLDQLLGGGLELGTTALFIGPPGTGKSTIAGVFVRSAALAGDRSAVFLFDERPETFKSRSEGVGFSLHPWLESGVVKLHRIETAVVTPGEFAYRMKEAVERDKVKVVVIDSLTGYFNAMTDMSMLAVQMHEVLTYLSRSGVLTVLIVASEGPLNVRTGPFVDVSYLSDAILVFRYYQTGGAIRRCLAALKKRQGEHDTTIRELVIGRGEVSIGSEPLVGIRGFMRNPELDPEST